MAVYSYITAQSAWSQARDKKAGKPIANNTRVLQRVLGDEVFYVVRLHTTDIVQYHADGRVVLSSGGWRTVTTKDRLNTHTDAVVWPDKGEWMLSWCGKDYFFADGITLHPDGSVTGAGSADDKAEARKMRRDIKRYAAKYVALLLSGALPVPSGGDCWMCWMLRHENKSTSPEHIKQHIEEGYFVPSLVRKATESFGSMIERSCVDAILFRTEQSADAVRVLSNEWQRAALEKHITRWMLRDAGLRF